MATAHTAWAWEGQAALGRGSRAQAREGRRIEAARRGGRAAAGRGERRGGRRRLDEQRDGLEDEGGEQLSLRHVEVPDPAKQHQALERKDPPQQAPLAAPAASGRLHRLQRGAAAGRGVGWREGGRERVTGVAERLAPASAACLAP